MIDEIQMMRDTDRGWAWSRALLGEFKQIGKDTFHELEDMMVHVY